MITQIAHSAFLVADMSKTLDFYCKKLGLQHAFSLADADGKPWIEYVKVGGGQFLEFFYGRDAKQDRQGEGFFESFSKSDPFQHLCLQVDDAEKTCAALVAQGISIGVMPQQGQDHNIQFWVKDPDGMPIEFMQISADSPQAKA